MQSGFRMTFLRCEMRRIAVDCGHSVTQATLGIQWHVLGMYGPSFFTGALVTRFGAPRVVVRRETDADLVRLDA